VIREIIALAGYVGLVAVLLFAPAGDARSWRSWTLLGVLLVVRFAGIVFLYRRNPDLLRERRKGPVQAGQPIADRVLLFLFMASFAALFAFAAFDAAHPSLGAPPADIAPRLLALFAAGWVLATHALAVNTHAILVVKHQREREHSVADTGAYRIVRHPMYAAMLVLMPGIGLWLRSWAGMLASAIPAGFLALRIVYEERLLERELPGYRAYQAKVAYRLIPGVW